MNESRYGPKTVWYATGILTYTYFLFKLPLPFKWDIEIKSEQKKKDKIMFALKIIQELFEKYGN